MQDHLSTTTRNVGLNGSQGKTLGEQWGAFWADEGLKGNRHARRRSRSRRAARSRRTAVARAFQGAELYRLEPKTTLAEAAMSAGSCITYIRAAYDLSQAEDKQPLCMALRGYVPLLVAAEMVRRVRRAVDAFGKLRGSDEPATFGREVGVLALWDRCISPLV